MMEKEEKRRRYALEHAESFGYAKLFLVALVFTLVFVAIPLYICFYQVIKDEDNSTMSLEYIKDYYKVPAECGVRVMAGDKQGTIVGSKGPHLKVHLDGDAISRIFHPTFKMKYLVKGEWFEFS